MKLSQQKMEKIKETILAFLFHSSPRAFFTSEIAAELARDEEFTRKMLDELKQKDFVVAVQKNAQGKQYERRIRWRIAPKIYETYKKLHEKGVEVY
jgi:Mn-dependent DtxR family transcriptional regulator